MHPSIYLASHLSIYLSIYLICLSMHLDFYLPIYLSIYLSVCLSIYLPVYLQAWKRSYSARRPQVLNLTTSKTRQFCETSSMFEVDNVKNEAILRDILNFWTWQRQKRSNSATLPHFSKLTTSKTKQFCETSSMFELDNVKNEAILRDFFILQSWQRQKRSNSSRLLHSSKLTTSKKKQFSETSSMFERDNIKNEAILRDFLIFEVDNIKNEAILRDFLQKWKVECRADGLVPMCFAIFPVHLSKLPRLPRKSDARSYEVLHLSRKSISANLKIWCSEMQPLSGNQRPDLLTALMKMSLVLRRPRKRHLCRSSANAPRLPSFLEMLQNPLFLLTFDKAHNPLRLPRETTSEPPKMVQTPSVFNILTSKCASRHNGLHFFDISTSKSGPSMVCVVHFDLEMCFAPQRRALFRHRNFQKWSEPDVLCTFWLGNVLRATTACTFSTSQLPKVVRAWFALYILTWRCASRHNGLHSFDISTSKSGPSMVCVVHFDLEMCFAPQRRALFRHLNFQKWSENGVFCTFWLRNVLRATTACNFSSLIWPAGSAPALASLLFDPPEPQTIGKTQFFLLSYLFAHLHLLSSGSFSSLIFSLLIFLFSLPLPCSAFHLSILLEVWLLNFLR